MQMSNKYREYERKREPINFSALCYPIMNSYQPFFDFLEKIIICIFVKL